MPAVARKNDQKISGGRPLSVSYPEKVRALAHDLRTPLSSLQSCLNLVLNGEAGSLTTDQKRFLGMARRNIDRLDRMVEGMLTSDRLPSESIPVKRCQVDGLSVSQVHLRWINPFPANLGEVMGNFDRVLVPELNTGQLSVLLRDKYLIDTHGFNKVYGQPFKTRELIEKIRELHDA